MPKLGHGKQLYPLEVLNSRNSRIETIRPNRLKINNKPGSISSAFSKLEWGRYLIVAQSSSGRTTSQTVYNRPDYYYEDQSASQATMLSFTSNVKLWA